MRRLDFFPCRFSPSITYQKILESIVGKFMQGRYVPICLKIFRSYYHCPDDEGVRVNFVLFAFLPVQLGNPNIKEPQESGQEGELCK